MLVRSYPEKVQADGGSRAGVVWADRQRRRYRQHAVPPAGGSRARSCRRRLPASRLQGRPRTKCGGVDRLRCALCVLPRDGKAWQAARRLHELTQRFQAKACPALDAGWTQARVSKRRQLWFAQQTWFVRTASRREPLPPGLPIPRLQGIPVETSHRFCPTGKSLLIFRNRVKPRNQKYFASLPTQISSLIRTVSFRQEGRIARRHETRDGMRWTRRRQASNSEPDEWR